MKSASRLAFLGVCINLVLAVIKVITGYLGNSQALIADGIESGTDVVSSTLVFFGLRYASRPADENHPYGHGRAEPLVTCMVSLFLAGAAVYIGISSVNNILHPGEPPAYYTLPVLAGVIVIKEILFRIMIRKAKELKSTTISAEAWHHRSDAVTSLAALIGISLALFLGKGFETSDDWASLAVSFIILYHSYGLLRPALAEIMDEDTHQELVADVRLLAVEVEGVRGTEKCFVRKTGTKYHIDLHARVDPDISVRDAHDISHRLKDHLLAKLPQLAGVLIHIEPA